MLVNKVATFGPYATLVKIHMVVASECYGAKVTKVTKLTKVVITSSG